MSVIDEVAAKFGIPAHGAWVQAGLDKAEERLRADYVAGHIDLERFEAKVDYLLSLRAEAPH